MGNGMALVPMSFQDMRQMAQILNQGKFLPKQYQTAEQVFTAMQMGRELGLQPMQSLLSIHYIDGRPSLSAEAMLGLILRDGRGKNPRWEITESFAKITIERDGDDVLGAGDQRALPARDREDSRSMGHLG